MDALKEATLAEIGNILINHVMGAISNMLKTRLSYRIPVYKETMIDNLVEDTSDMKISIADTSFSISTLSVQGDLIIAFQLESFQTLLDGIQKLVE